MEKNFDIRVRKNLADITSAELAQMIELLPDWRRQKALAYKFEQGRKECAVAYLLLCEMLRDNYGITEMPEFEYGEHGKPSIVGHPEIHFNFSHCKAAVACAVGSVPLGVDIECLGRWKESLGRYTLSDEEYDQVISAENTDEAFIQFWTKKEAVLKLTGEGITNDVKHILHKYNNVRIETQTDRAHGFVLSWAYLLT